MDVTTDTKTLTDALTVLKRYAGSGAGIVPAQDWAELRVNDGGASLTVRRWARKTNADVTANVEASGGTPGVAYVDATLLAASVKTLTGTITLALTDTDRGPRLTITGDGGSAELRAENGADFPVRTSAAFVPFVTITDGKRDALRSVVNAAAKGHDARAVLTGVHFDADAAEAAATDTYRLHVARFGGTHVLRDGIVPADVLRTVLATAGPGSVLMDATDDGAHYCAAYTAEKGPKRAKRRVFVTVVGRMIEGPFPNYATLRPDPDDVTARWTIADAAGTADVFRALRNTQNAPAIVTPAGSAVRVSLTDRDGGTREAVAPIVTDADTIGDDEYVAFNPQYFADAITHAGDGATVKLRNAMKGAAFDADDRYALLMPMRVA